MNKTHSISSEFNNEPQGLAEELIASTHYFQIHKVRIGLKWMVRKQPQEKHRTDITINSMLLKEFEIGSSFSHKHIPQYLFIDSSGGYTKLYIQYIDGKNITQLNWNSFDANFTNKLISNLLISALETLIYLKENGISHGDLHSGNIIYTPLTDRFYLIDFGLATSDEYINLRDDSLLPETNSLLQLSAIVHHILLKTNHVSTGNIKRFLDSIKNNASDLSFEKAKAILTSKTSKINKYYTSLLVFVVLLGLFFVLILPKKQFTTPPKKSTTGITQSKSIKKTTSNSQSKLHIIKPVNESKMVNNKELINSYRFIYAFENCDTIHLKQRRSFRNSLVIRYHDSFMNHLTRLPISDQNKKNLISDFNKQYYIDYLHSENILSNTH